MTTASQIDLQFFRCGEDSRKVGLHPASTFWRSTAVHSENFSSARHLCKRLVESFFRRICPGSALLRFGDGLVLLECSTTPTTSPQEQKGVRSDRIRESPTNERQEKLPFVSPETFWLTLGITAGSITASCVWKRPVSIHFWRTAKLVPRGAIFTSEAPWRRTVRRCCIA